MNAAFSNPPTKLGLITWKDKFILTKFMEYNDKYAVQQRAMSTSGGETGELGNRSNGNFMVAYLGWVDP